MNSAQAAKNALIDQNQELLETFNATSDIRSIVSTRCQHVDKLLQKQWHAHHLEQFPIALIAVGGYGRGELHPHSDVDLLFLTEGELSQDAEQALG
ncbi:nucleotidyltransferase domain-containing protein, partial [Shewanella sp. 0m-11]